MFEKLAQAAEGMATGVSRRRFLVRLGGGAAALAATLGGVLAQSALARKPSAPTLYCDVVITPPQCAGAAVGAPCGRERDYGGRRGKWLFCHASTAQLPNGTYGCSCF